MFNSILALITSISIQAKCVNMLNHTN